MEDAERVRDLLKGTTGMFSDEGEDLFGSATLLPVLPAVLTAVEDEEGEAESGDEEGDEGAVMGGMYAIGLVIGCRRISFGGSSHSSTVFISVPS